MDDNGTSRRFLEEVLEECGIETRAAGSGAAGLAALGDLEREGRVCAFAIVDSCMPGEDTCELVGRMLQKSPALHIVVLTSPGHTQNYDRFRAIGIESYMAKPVNPDELYAGVADMERGVAVSTEIREKVAPAVDSIRPLLILVAEDNVVNQRVALRTLQKMGHEVVVVSNGRDAVEAARQRSFDLILMDVQMPVMDGFEATAALRDREKLHVPIVAMTAHAMAGDRELCLSAGMDDYLSKSIDADALMAIIQKLCADEAIEVKS